MKFTIIAAAHAPHQIAHQVALRDGLAAHGIESALSYGGAVQTRHVACWGWRRGKQLRAAGHEVLVMERGYIGDRFAWTSIAWNGLNGRGRFPSAPDDNGKRFGRIAKLRPWKQDGQYILLLGQVPGDASLDGKDLTTWYAWAAMQAGNAYELPVRFRQHPKAAEKGFHQNPSYTHPISGTLEEALAGAAVAIAWNSNAAVDAVLAGVPTVTMDEGSMARAVTAHRIGPIERPERSTWAHALAWKQWTMQEIASGLALESLLYREIV